MLKNAVDHYNSVGRTQALADFTNRVAPFFDRDLYVACIDGTLHINAHGLNPKYVGELGGPLNQAAWDAASSSVSSVNYAFTDPVTRNNRAKNLL